MRWLLAVCWALIFMLAACSSSPTPSKKGAYYLDDGPPKGSVDLANVKDAIPRSEPLSKTGNKPYVVFGKRYVPLKSNAGFKQKGTASWYGKKFHGKRTSSGETYDMYKMTAAHTVLPIPSYAKVTNLNNGRSIIVRVNDRGPFKHNRVMDLSYAAALKLDVVKTGTGRVEIIAINDNKQVSKPQPLKKDSQRVTIQLGAFSNYDSALKLQKRLQADGYSKAMIETIQQNELNIYRVRLGPIKEPGNIDFTLGDLHHGGYADAHIIVETVN
ncbi:MAG: septal ring lytic transglycosylase RlpA family protein [Gammaproteobacteria bacterium]|nr:septal ring lytic transglycosylase RlpA family protein [Gammaproteobacteria bacterium]